MEVVTSEQLRETRKYDRQPAAAWTAKETEMPTNTLSGGFTPLRAGAGAMRLKSLDNAWAAGHCCRGGPGARPGETTRVAPIANPIRVAARRGAESQPWRCGRAGKNCTKSYIFEQRGVPPYVFLRNEPKKFFRITKSSRNEPENWSQKRK